MDTRKTVKKKLVLKKSVRNFITRVLITVIIFLVGMILVKSNSDFKNIILDEVYDNNFKFTKIKDFYQKYYKLSNKKFIRNKIPKVYFMSN